MGMGRIALTGENINAFKILVRKPDAKCVNNIEIDFKTIHCDGLDWIYLPQVTV
jgi:hypothetical protein